jgi:hypothetical protein
MPRGLIYSCVLLRPRSRLTARQVEEAGNRQEGGTIRSQESQERKRGHSRLRKELPEENGSGTDVSK